MAFNFRLTFLGLALAAIVPSAMPARAATYYVSTTGDNGNEGTEAEPWRTITYAATRAIAGDTVYIKGGNYGTDGTSERVVVKNSGSKGHPITFEGYSGTVNIGKYPNSPRATPGTSDIGFSISGKSYITVKNINLNWYYACMSITNSSSTITLQNLYIYDCGAKSSAGEGIHVKDSNYVTIKNCEVKNCGGNNVNLRKSHYCTIDNLQTRGTYATGGDDWVTDYYCVLVACHDCEVKNSHAHDEANSGKGNHGFIIKDGPDTPHSYNITISDCTAISFEECFSVAHMAYNNKFINCVADNSLKPTGSATYNTAFQARNGAHHNEFINCTGTGRRCLVAMTDYNENSHFGAKSYNVWRNCTFKGTGLSTSFGVFFNGADHNTFENCVFDNVQYFARYTELHEDNENNSFKNCIVNNIDATYDPTNFDPDDPDLIHWGGTALNQTSGLTATYNCFNANGFGAFSGTGNFTADPLFASSSDYHLKSTAGRWNGSSWVTDAVDSPCIDAGDPASSCATEPAPNGGLINIGRYGNTAEASKSSDGGGGGTVLPPHDNRLAERTPTTVYAASSFLDVGHLVATDSRRYRDLIWFDLSQYSDSVAQATLSLYWYHPPSATRTNDTIVDIYRPAMGWNHDYVCWTNKASGAAWTNAGGDWFDKNGTAQGSTPYASVTFVGSQVATNQYYAFDVTALVNQYIQSGQNAGFLIKARTESDNYIAFYGLSATDSATRPKMVITLDSDIWVDFSWAGTESGSQSQPFNTLAEGIEAIAPDKTLHIKTGETAESARIVKAMRIVAENGLVRLGASGATTPPSSRTPTVSPDRTSASNWMLYK